ncbi:MAG: prolipoprotein diacylglyceryl transferase [Planctomycetes bacterium]|jgi:prolipoprotein diacylglyceryltransferase|nr:prolipoprotein diacylglyceryl transferase [Planctomycetota bacterium]MCL4729548.1 prolipoprotein diacylglyceryl transferase [Planctomycetota bacterium]
MLGVLTHPRLAYDWFTTTLLRWDGGLVIYDQWLIGANGVGAWSGQGGTVLLDVYYSCYLIAFLGVLYFFGRFRKQGWLKVQPHVPYDALLLAMIGVLVGAKTAYIFIYNPDFYFGPPPYGPVDTKDQLERIFLNWSGMASHGAATGIVLMALFWWLKSRPPIAQIGDVGCISGAFGAIWIRLANFLNGELYGRAASPDLPWAMRFPVRSGKSFQVVQHQGQLYERMFKPEDPAQVEAWLKALTDANPGGVIDRGSYVLYHNPQAYLQGYELAVRNADGVIEYVATPPRPPASERTLFFDLTEYPLVTTPRHPSQLYQLLLEGVLLLAFLLWFRRRVKRAGMVAGAFFTGYPLARFIGEFWRQPDVQFQAQGNELGTVFLGLSMGQVLSLLMACFGLGVLFWFSRKGKVIADQTMWPPDKKPAPLTVPFETGTGGSSAAGDIQGITEVRAALAEKEKEWDKAEQARNPEKKEG